jgi:hypothetical protein
MYQLDSWDIDLIFNQQLPDCQISGIALLVLAALFSLPLGGHFFMVFSASWSTVICITSTR